MPDAASGCVFDADCRACPRLLLQRDADAVAHPQWHAAPVAAAGPTKSRLLIVGLAPGRLGAHRTGRPFWGDDSGDWLHEALLRHGFARAREGGRPPALKGCRITNAVRCLPPGNRPTSAERRRCSVFLQRDLGELCGGGRRQRPVAILALGRFAHEAVLLGLGRGLSGLPFFHGAEHPLAKGVTLVDSYHCSRYNTRTGRLTWPMFDAVFERLEALTLRS
ncbi:MAG: uracil-DNA glycosylase [Gammaproteobacteria bacterium]|nr:uracil-DNA glycosylase [Gammaproteobacteria bacterium]